MIDLSDVLLLNKGTPNNDVLLEEWIVFSGKIDIDPITDKSKDFFRHFWSTWNQYLEKRKVGEGGLSTPDTRWVFARKEDVASFLKEGPRNRKREAPVSEITRRRYWRLLERIYGYAARRGFISASPVDSLEIYDIPKQEDPKAAIVDSVIWAEAHRRVLAMDQVEPGNLRNRALLLLLMEHGPIPQEIRTARVHDVLRARDGTITHLQVDGPGRNQRRQLALSGETAKALSAWLDARARLVMGQHSETLFCSTSSPDGPMDPDRMLQLCTQLLLASAAAVNHPPPARLGPQVIRNTRQVLWINSGVPPAQVAVWSGLKDAKGFRHLRELVNPEIRPYLLGALRPRKPRESDVPQALCEDRPLRPPAEAGRRLKSSGPVQGSLFD